MIHYDTIVNVPPREGSSRQPKWSYLLVVRDTNINHKGLPRTANEYAQERRIYKDLISKNNNVDILNSASRILQCWSYYVKMNSARHQHDTEKNSKQSEIVAIDSCFALLGARDGWRCSDICHIEESSEVTKFSPRINISGHTILSFGK